MEKRYKHKILCMILIEEDGEYSHKDKPQEWDRNITWNYVCTSDEIRQPLGGQRLDQPTNRQLDFGRL